MATIALGSTAAALGLAAAVTALKIQESHPTGSSVTLTVNPPAAAPVVAPVPAPAPASAPVVAPVPAPAPASAPESDTVPAGWKRWTDPSTGHVYYQNDTTKTTQWKRPAPTVASRFAPLNPFSRKKTQRVQSDKPFVPIPLPGPPPTPYALPPAPFVPIPLPGPPPTPYALPPAPAVAPVQAIDREAELDARLAPEPNPFVAANPSAEPNPFQPNPFGPAPVVGVDREAEVQRKLQEADERRKANPFAAPVAPHKVPPPPPFRPSQPPPPPPRAPPPVPVRRAAPGAPPRPPVPGIGPDFVEDDDDYVPIDPEEEAEEKAAAAQRRRTYRATLPDLTAPSAAELAKAQRRRTRRADRSGIAVPTPSTSTGDPSPNVSGEGTPAPPFRLQAVPSVSNETFAARQSVERKEMRARHSQELATLQSTQASGTGSDAEKVAEMDSLSARQSQERADLHQRHRQERAQRNPSVPGQILTPAATPASLPAMTPLGEQRSDAAELPPTPVDVAHLHDVADAANQRVEEARARVDDLAAKRAAADAAAAQARAAADAAHARVHDISAEEEAKIRAEAEAEVAASLAAVEAGTPVPPPTADVPPPTAALPPPSAAASVHALPTKPWDARERQVKGLPPLTANEYASLRAIYGNQNFNNIDGVPFSQQRVRTRGRGRRTRKHRRVLTFRRKPKTRSKNGRRPARKSTVRRNR